MRLSTAVTLTLVALLATAALGAVAATPSAPPSPDRGADQSPMTFEQSPSLSPVESGTLADSHGERQHALLSTSDDGVYGEPAQTEQIIRINVSDDGDAHWSLEYRFVLRNEDQEETFTDYADAVTAGERDPVADDPGQAFREMAAEASTATDREMSIVDAGWSEYDIEPYDDDVDTEDAPEGTYEDEKIGTISYTFTWTNFATTDDDRIYIGDALQTGENGSLSTLYPNQRLVIESPDNYGLETPTQLTWNGYHEFSENEFEIVFLRGAQPGDTFSWVSIPLIIGLLGLVGVLALGSVLAYRYARGDNRSPLTQLLAKRDDTAGDSRPRSDTGADAAVDERPPELADAPEDDGTQLEFSERANRDVDPELLSDEERVQRMLAENGGRMKQAAIVSETGWSNAKVSQLLSQMDDDDQIEKLRIGRENLITLPEVDPTEID